MSGPDRLWLIGPLPPPTGGATRTFDVYRSLLVERGVDLEVVDTSPSSVPRLPGRTYRWAVLLRLLVWWARTRSDGRPVLWFTSPAMALLLHRVIAATARRHRVAVYSFGGVLGARLLALSPRRRRRVAADLNRVGSLFVESELAAAELERAGVVNARPVGAAWRPTSVAPVVERRPDRPLVLAYAGRITETKGIPELFRLAELGRDELRIKLMGPVDADLVHRLGGWLRDTPNVEHLGDLTGERVLQELVTADFSVLLSRYPGEGIPGGVVESLQVGTPAIVSAFRALPEAVRDGVSGLVVPEDEEGRWDLEGLLERLRALGDDDLASLRRGAAATSTPESAAGQLDTVLDVLRPAPGGPRSQASRILYILGRGHSGSTMLDVLLDNVPGLVGVGGAVAALDRLEITCTCGRPMADCDLWAAVRAEAAARTGEPWARTAQVNQRQALVTRFPITLLAPRSSRRLADEARHVGAVYDAVSSVTGCDGVVDGSKTPTRALLVARSRPDSVFVHLVRDPLGVLASNLVRIREGRHHFMRRTTRTRGLVWPFLLLNAVTWTVGNLLCEVVVRVARGRAIRVRYEDLMEDPGHELERIGALAGFDVGLVVDAVAEGRPLDLGHKVSGNATVRRAGSLVFDPGRRDSRRLPARHARMARVVTWPLRRRYGYIDAESSGRREG